MRKVIGVTLAGAMLFGLSAGMVGCSDETGTKEETKVTNEVKVQKSGENPPLAPTEPTKP
jgi:hypothetical protein